MSHYCLGFCSKVESDPRRTHSFLLHNIMNFGMYLAGDVPQITEASPENVLIRENSEENVDGEICLLYKYDLLCSY